MRIKKDRELDSMSAQQVFIAALQRSLQDNQIGTVINSDELIRLACRAAAIDIVDRRLDSTDEVPSSENKTPVTKDWGALAQNIHEEHLKVLGQQVGAIGIKSTAYYGVAQILYRHVKDHDVFAKGPLHSKELVDAIRILDENRVPDFESIEALDLAFQKNAHLFANGRMPKNVKYVGEMIDDRQKQTAAAIEFGMATVEASDESIRAVAKGAASALIEAVQRKVGRKTKEDVAVERIEANQLEKNKKLDAIYSNAFKAATYSDRLLSVTVTTTAIVALSLGSVPMVVTLGLAVTGVLVKTAVDLTKQPKAMRKYYDDSGVPQESVFAPDGSGASPREMNKMWVAYMNEKPLLGGMAMNARLMNQSTENLQKIFHRAYEIIQEDELSNIPKSKSTGLGASGKANKGKNHLVEFCLDNAKKAKADVIVAALDKSMKEMCEDPEIKARSSISYAAKSIGTRVAIYGVAAALAEPLSHGLEHYAKHATESLSYGLGHYAGRLAEWVVPAIPGFAVLLSQSIGDVAVDGGGAVAKGILDAPGKVGASVVKGAHDVKDMAEEAMLSLKERLSSMHKVVVAEVSAKRVPT